MQYMSVFSRGSDEWAVSERYHEEFHPVLPREVQIYMLTKFPWEDIRLSRTTRYAPNHKLAKRIHPVTKGKRYSHRTLAPESIAALGNAIIMQCIWGLTAMNRVKSYKTVAKQWRSVLAKLPTSPCPDIELGLFKTEVGKDKPGAEVSEVENAAGVGDAGQSRFIELGMEQRHEERYLEEEHHKELERPRGIEMSTFFDNIEKLLRDVRAKEEQLFKDRKALAYKENELSIAVEKLKEFQKVFQDRPKSVSDSARDDDQSTQMDIGNGKRTYYTLEDE